MEKENTNIVESKMKGNQNLQVDFMQIQAMNNIFRQSDEKLNDFKNRLKAFGEISTLEEAKELAKRIMPVSQEINHFKIGGAKCVVVNRDDMFRVSLDTDEEYISYDFT